MSNEEIEQKLAGSAVFHLHHHHHEHPTSVFVPRPWKKHRHEIMQQRSKKHLNVDDQDKKIEFSELDERVKTVPFGCLSFHILELIKVSVSNSTFDPTAPLFYYCVLQVGTIRRVTKCVISYSPRRVRIDSAILFSIELSEWRANYRNKMKIEYWTFQEPGHHYIIGTAQLHLYNFIHHIHGIESHYIWGDGLLRGKMIYEYTFSYGSFGFGHSNQFRNTDISIFETVSHSLFPRIRLEDDDIVEAGFNTILPSKLKMMSKNSFVLEKPKDSRKNTKEKSNTKSADPAPVPKSIRLHQVEFKGGHPIHCKVHVPIYQTEIEPDFNETYGDFLCITKRTDRVEFCRRLVKGRRQDILETEYATPLFYQLQKDSLEPILDPPEGTSPNYPANVQCSYGHKAVVYPQDEKLFEAFPSTDRSSGYLGRLFGFGAHEPEDVRPDFPLQELQRKRKKYKSQVSLSLWMRYIWSRFGAFITWLRFLIIPGAQAQQRIPEISVTLPSPDISTTDLCALWVDPDPDHAVLSEEYILKQEAHRFGLPVPITDNKVPPDEGQGENHEQGQAINKSSDVKDDHLVKPNTPDNRDDKGDKNYTDTTQQINYAKKSK